MTPNHYSAAEIANFRIDPSSLLGGGKRKAKMMNNDLFILFEQHSQYIFNSSMFMLIMLPSLS